MGIGHLSIGASHRNSSREDSASLQKASHGDDDGKKRTSQVVDTSANSSRHSTANAPWRYTYSQDSGFMQIKLSFAKLHIMLCHAEGAKLLKAAISKSEEDMDSNHEKYLVTISPK